jgi:ATP-dependent DNA helicase 2 subunit 1
LLCFPRSLNHLYAITSADYFLGSQEEQPDATGWNEPAGIHLIQLPFADDIRAAPIEEGYRASEELKEAARAWIDKLCVKNGAYPPDSYPNPGMQSISLLEKDICWLRRDAVLAFHNAQLEATAFREEFDPESFEDVTLPKIDAIHKVWCSSMYINNRMTLGQRVGKLVETWNEVLKADDRADIVVATKSTGTKRKADVATGGGGMDDAEIRQRFDEGLLNKVC